VGEPRKVIIINMNGPRVVVCGGCHEEIVCEKHAVAIDDCGSPTTEETGQFQSTCKAFHDMLYGPGSDMQDCPQIKDQPHD